MLHCTKTMIAQLATHRNKRRISFKKRNEGILVSAGLNDGQHVGQVLYDVVGQRPQVVVRPLGARPHRLQHHGAARPTPRRHVVLPVPDHQHLMRLHSVGL
eukprot:EG_transcript_60733